MPRIDPRSDPGDSEQLKVVFDQLLATRGRIPTMYGVLAHHPAILSAHRAYFHAALDSGRLDRAFKEKIAFRTAVVCGSPYSSASHRSYALRHGVNDAELSRIEVGEYTGMSHRDRAALAFADEVASTRSASDEAFAQLSEHFESPEIIEITALVGLMVLASTLGAVFDLDPDNSADGP